ncbi:MAG: DUF1566 domain-containing protein [Bdellovibrionales bacterium]|nr:DUF1566 domain-containing protein [Bdellovibrionales bacterium]
MIENSKIIVTMKRKIAPLDITISDIKVINHQIIITGTKLNSVNALNIHDKGVVTTLAIESKNNTSIIANTLSNSTFVADKMLDLIFSNAEAAATYTINFSLCNSTLNGAGFDCSVDAQDSDVLSYDQGTGKWKPKSINGLTYKGTYDATGAAPVSSGPSAAGEYYIISVAGHGYTVGDWAVDNGTSIDKIDNSPSAVSTVHGRIGAVVGAEADYTLDQLGDVTLGSPAIGNILRFNGTAWVPGTVTTLESDPTVSAFAKSSLPTCAAGEVLKSNGSAFSCVADVSGGGAFTGAANRVVTTNGSGALSASSVTDTVLGYLTGVTSSIQTQLDSKASSAAITNWSAHSNTGPYIYPTRIYGGAIQASKTLVTDVSGNIVTSSVTPAELGYLAGVTSSIQTQLNAVSGGGAWTVASGNAYRTTGNIGIGTASPAATLEVVGDIKIGNSNATCTNALKGSMRYNSGSNSIEFCSGTSWTVVQASTCTDATPVGFAYTAVANSANSTLNTTGLTQITGITCSVSVTVSGQGSPQVKICSDSSCTSVIQDWTSSTTSIENNQYLQVRLTSDGVGGSTYKATVFVGSGATVWNVTTAGGDCVSTTPAVGTICADGTVYAGLSPDGNNKMFTTPCDAGQSWSGVACTGVRSTLPWNNGSGVGFETGINSVATGRANTSALAALAGTGSPYTSAQYCESLTANGNSDWYLPAISELSVLYSNSGAIRNFDTTSLNYYLSSSEKTGTSGEGQGYVNAIYFLNGTTGGNYAKSSNFHVRCVRR